jgi:hypothetical protein
MVIDFYWWLIGVSANNIERIAIAIISLTGITILGIYKVVDSQAVVAIYSSVIGFMLGHKTGALAEREKQNNFNK